MTVVATAGHVDHGKTSLVHALSGVNTDRLEEEQRRGLTIDLGFAHTSLATSSGLPVDVSFVDVPGHIKFLRNMLAGVGGIDACLFVVDAREGWMPQSEEHFEILRLLDIPRGIVALTKIDLVEPAEADAVESTVRARIDGTFLAGASIVRTSVHDRASIDHLARQLADLPPRDRPPTHRPRLWIDRSFAPTGVGAVVTGTVLDAPLAKGAEVQVLPSGLRARIRGLQSRGDNIDTGTPGMRLAVNLSGVSHNDIHRGDLLVLPDQWHLTTVVDARLQVLPHLSHDVSRRGNYLFYVGSDEIPGTLRVMGSGSLPPGATGTARLFLDRPVALAPHDRFIVRETGRDETVAGGTVLDVDPVVPMKRADPSADLDRFIDDRGMVGIDHLFVRTGQIVEPTVDDVIFSSAMLTAAKSRLLDLLSDAGTEGVDPGTLPDHLRQVAHTLRPAEAVTESGRLYPPEHAPSRRTSDPIVDAFTAAGFTPPDPSGFDRGELRRLVQRGLLVNLDGIFFASAALDAAHDAARRLLVAAPEGFSASQFREALGTTRKYAIPLAEALDARGITRRRGDLRIAGPRLDR